MRSTPQPRVQGNGRRTQAQRREQSGLGLLQAAIALVAERGVGAATFQAIGARSGYSRSLVTQRFGSKQGLISAVIQHTNEIFDALFEDGSVDTLPGLDAILTYMDLYLTELSTNDSFKAYFMLLSSSIAELSDLRNTFSPEHDRAKTRLADVVSRGQSDGSIRPEIDADAAALMIGSLQLGVSMQLLVDPQMDLAPIRATVSNMIRLSFSASQAPA